jgi:hypothetical protein
VAFWAKENKINKREGRGARAGQACMADVAGRAMQSLDVGRSHDPGSSFSSRHASASGRRGTNLGSGQRLTCAWRRSMAELRRRGGGSRPSSCASRSSSSLRSRSSRRPCLQQLLDNGDGGDFRRPWTVGKGALERADDGEQEAARRKGRGGRGRARPCPPPSR